LSRAAHLVTMSLTLPHCSCTRVIYELRGLNFHGNTATLSVKSMTNNEIVESDATRNSERERE
jgi:hypothetical protein